VVASPQALPGTPCAPRRTAPAGQPSRGRRWCALPPPPSLPRRCRSAAAFVFAAVSDTAALLGSASGSHRVRRLSCDTQRPPPPPPCPPVLFFSPNRRRLVRSHNHRQHHRHRKGRDQSSGERAAGRCERWPPAAEGALCTRRLWRLEPLPPPQVLWGNVWEKRPPLTNHNAGNPRYTGRTRANNADMARI